MILSSHAELGDTGKSTGWCLSEAAHTWKVLTGADHNLTWVSPKGGHPRMEKRDLSDEINIEFLEQFYAAVPSTVAPDQVDATDFDAIFFIGGHGPMWDFPHNTELSTLAAKIYADDGVVAAVCHGPAALLNIELADGSKLIDGKRVAGFTNSEEAAQGLSEVVPFLLEDALKASGADHQTGPDFEAKVVVDDRLVTGQNPPSATDTASAVVAAIRETQAAALTDLGWTHPKRTRRCLPRQNRRSLRAGW
ncbi:MAG: putative intracellular protease/amidase [Ilumatobacter sp.]|jgi:putative intracellular protease/amidase